MSLYKRLHDVQAAPATGSKRRDPVLDELRQKIHHHLIDELGPILYDKRLSEDDLRRRVNDQLHAALAQERAPLSAADKAQLIQDVSDDILGYGPIDRLLHDDEITEVMCNGPDVGLRRAGRPAREVDRHLRRRDPPAAHHRQDRERDRSPHRRGQPALRRPPARRLPGQRRDPPAGHRRALPHHPEVLHRAAPGRRPDPVRHPQRPRRPLPAGVRGRAAQHHRVGRYRHRQDHHPQRAVVVHPVRRAHRDRRGRQGAPAPPGPRAGARGPPAQHRGSGRDHHPRPGQELPAHAARPHRGRGVPLGRGPRHAPGHEHRPRRLAHHRALQQPARHPGPARDPGADGRASTCPSGPSASRWPRPSTASCTSPACATAPAASPTSPRSRAWRATSSPCRTSSCSTSAWASTSTAGSRATSRRPACARSSPRSWPTWASAWAKRCSSPRASRRKAVGGQ